MRIEPMMRIYFTSFRPVVFASKQAEQTSVGNWGSVWLMGMESVASVENPVEGLREDKRGHQ